MAITMNTNVASINAQRNLNKTQGSLMGNFGRLSTGLRINTAADDAAGLAISEKLKSQIRSLSQAERNAYDGNSLLQVAEGAMNEVSGILTRMRELAVQSATDTVGGTERGFLNQEVDALQAELDRIGEVTVSQSGDMYLCTTLDGADPRWQRLSGPDFVVLPSPQRAYDSRPGQSPTSGSQTPLGAQGNRTIDLTTETDLPDDAVAALLNVTITNTTGAGFVSFYSAGEADKPAGFAGFASVNSTGAGQTIGNNVTTGLDAGALKIYASRATDIVIDVVAYHRGPIDSTRGLG